MTSNRMEQIGEYKIEEIYWNGLHIVYVNNRLIGLTFEEACKAYKELEGVESK